MKISPEELQIPRTTPGRSRFDTRLCKFCDIKDWEQPWLGQIIVDLLKTAGGEVLVHRKAWEFALTIKALRNYGLWNRDSVGLSVAAGHETLLYYATNHLGRIVATDIYGEGDFAETTGEASSEFLKSPEKYAPYPYESHRLKPLWMNALDLKFADNTFDFAYSLSSIEHFGGLKPAVIAIREMARVVKPGGLVCVSVDCVINGDNTVQFFTPETVQQMVAESGLTLIEDIDWSISPDSLQYLIDMAKDDLNLTPHVNLTAFGSIFTSVNLVLVKKEHSGSSISYAPLRRTNLVAFDEQLRDIEKSTTFSHKQPTTQAGQPQNDPDTTVWPQVHVEVAPVDAPEGPGLRVQQWLKSFSPEAPLVVALAKTNYLEAVVGLESLVTHTPSDIPLLILVRQDADSRLQKFVLNDLVGERVFGLAWEADNSVAKALNLAVDWSAPHDVVVVNSETIMPEEWLERLQAAARIHSTVATASPLTSGWDFLSIQDSVNHTEPPLAMDVAQIDRRIRENSLLLRPQIPSAGKHCVYYRRTALEIIGAFDESLPDGIGLETDFSQRALGFGFYHVAADDLFVYSQLAASSLVPTSLETRLGPERVVRQRYPWLVAWQDRLLNDTGHGFRLALEQSRMALNGFKIAIDGSALNSNPTGTQFVVVGLVKALTNLPNRSAFKLFLVVPDNLPAHRFYGLEKLVDETIKVSSLENLDKPVFDLIHRPYQIFAYWELVFLKQVARRVVITQMDFIYYSNPTYFRNSHDWNAFQKLTEMVLNSVDGATYMSREAANSAGIVGLSLPQNREAVTYIGVENPFSDVEPIPPAGAVAYAGKPFIFLLGNNYRHKNRVYALKVFARLLENYGWDGHLVMGGPSISQGNSLAEEILTSFNLPALKERIHHTGLLEEAEKQWLFRRCSLVLYPSLVEGFGLVPFEAAALDKPALAARTSSIVETLGDEVLYLELVDPATDAATISKILNDPGVSLKQVNAVKKRVPEYRWDKVAQLSFDFYRHIMRLPARSVLENSVGMQEAFKEKDRISGEYQKLQAWASELNKELLKVQKNRLYRLTKRLKPDA